MATTKLHNQILLSALAVIMAVSFSFPPVALADVQAGAIAAQADGDAQEESDPLANAKHILTLPESGWVKYTDTESGIDYYAEPNEGDENDAMTATIKFINLDNKKTDELLIPGEITAGDGIKYTVTRLGTANWAKLDILEGSNWLPSDWKNIFCDPSSTYPSNRTSLDRNVTGPTPVLKSLTKICIPASVKEIEEFTFSGAYGVTNIEFAQESQLQTLGGASFSSCSVERVELPDSITTMGDSAKGSAFSYCKSLKSINIPSNLEKLGYDSLNAFFTNNHSLSEIRFADDSKLKTIGGSVFDGYSDGFQLLKSVKIPKSVESLGGFSPCQNLVDFDYSNATNLTTLTAGLLPKTIRQFTIPSTVQSLQGNVFSGSGLVYLDVPLRLLAKEGTSAQTGKFNGSLNMVRVDIHAEDESGGANININSNAFDQCPSLSSIVFHGPITKLSFQSYWCTNVGWNPSNKLRAIVFDGDTSKAELDAMSSINTPVFDYVENDAVVYGLAEPNGDDPVVKWATENGKDYRKLADTSAVKAEIMEPQAKYMLPAEDGEALEPAVTVKNGNDVLDSANYSLTYIDNDKAGEAAVLVSGLKEYSAYKQVIPFSVGEQGDATDLNADIAAAKQASAAANVSAAGDGSEFTADEQYVTVAAKSALDAAIAAAEKAAAADPLYADDVEAAQAALAAAVKAFEDSRAAGTNASLGQFESACTSLPEKVTADNRDAAAAVVESYTTLSDHLKAKVTKEELTQLVAAQTQIAAIDAAAAEKAREEAVQAAKTEAAKQAQTAQQAANAAQKTANEAAAKAAQLQKDLDAAKAEAAAAKSQSAPLAKPTLTKKTKSSKKGKVTVAWNKVSGATGYEVKVGSKTYTVKKASTLKKTVKAAKGKKVKVQVRAFKTQGDNTMYSKWSASKKVKVKK